MYSIGEWRSWLLLTSLCVLLVVSSMHSYVKGARESSCDPSTCRLENNCHCRLSGAPGNLTRNHTPQIVMFTFDDAVRKPEFEMYSRLFHPSRVNPNGCPISMTMFVSHQYTSYSYVKKLYELGMEAAVHSISHNTGFKHFSSDKVKQEIIGQRNNIHTRAAIPLEHIRGWRSPFLYPVGEILYQTLHNESFLYDATLSVDRRDYSRNNQWPFTLDHGSGGKDRCLIPECPYGQYPGLWEIPIIPFIAKFPGTDLLMPFTYVDSFHPPNEKESYDYLWENFKSFYYGNRAPFMLNMHSAWFLNGFSYNLEAMDKFILKLLSLNDVYIINIQKAIAWMRGPVSVNVISSNFPEWGCVNPIIPRPMYEVDLNFVTAAPTTPDASQPGLDASVTMEPCNQGNCIAPSCLCEDSGSPGELEIAEIPQMVVFTFDDAVTVSNIGFYDSLFRSSRLNPNGCPIGMTLFVQDNYTDYGLVDRLHKRGMEIAVHSVTHKGPTAWWRNANQEQLIQEVVGQKNNLSRLANIESQELRGWRSPFLQPTGETQFRVLKENGFEYDATLSLDRSSMDDEVAWPSTLDYGWQRDCLIKPCPRHSYRGLWEFPVAPVINTETGYLCVYIDACRPNNETAARDFLVQNFLSHYESNRSPFSLNLHASWFAFEHNLKATEWFIENLINRYEDVYIVTVHQTLEWIKNPTPLANIKSFAPWNCDQLKARLASDPGSSTNTDTGWVTRAPNTWQQRTPGNTWQQRTPANSGNSKVVVDTDGTWVRRQVVSNTQNTLNRYEPDDKTVAPLNNEQKQNVDGMDADASVRIDGKNVQWFIILLIVLAILCSLLFAALLIFSILRKHQYIKKADLEAAFAEYLDENEETKLPYSGNPADDNSIQVPTVEPDPPPPYLPAYRRAYETDTAYDASHSDLDSNDDESIFGVCRPVPPDDDDNLTQVKHRMMNDAISEAETETESVSGSTGNMSESALQHGYEVKSGRFSIVPVSKATTLVRTLSCPGSTISQAAIHEDSCAEDEEETVRNTNDSTKQKWKGHARRHSEGMSASISLDIGDQTQDFSLRGVRDSDMVPDSQEGHVDSEGPLSIDITEDDSIDITEDDSIDITEDDSIDITEDDSIDITEDDSIDITEDDSIDISADGSIDISMDDNESLYDQIGVVV